MNPEVKTLQDDQVIFALTDEDRKKLRQVKLIGGEGHLEEIAMHKMCIMQTVSMVTHQADVKVTRIPISEYPDEADYEGESYDDHPVCVSAVITSYMIELNDHVTSVRLRNKLKAVVDDILNTCPVRRRYVERGPKNKKYTAIGDRRLLTREYKAAEKARQKILDQVPVTDRDDKYNSKILMTHRIAAIREAAAVFHAGTTTEPAQSK